MSAICPLSGVLVDSFKQAGHGEAPDSWVGHGANKQIGPSDLEKAIGPDVLATLSQHTGLSREEILARLSKKTLASARLLYVKTTAPGSPRTTKILFAIGL
jgi:hypothetical protein